jgi:glycosyltransferase involved in cell wall biosynthesis
MKIVHIHFGKDGGAERFFVKLANGFSRRGVEQQFFIRPDRLWRKDIEACGPVHEGVFRRISLSRFVLAARIRRVLKQMKPDAIIAWAPRASQAMPAKADALRLGRLGDYPLKLDYFGNLDIIICNTPDISKRVKELGWQRPVETISNFSTPISVTPVDRASLNTPEDAFLVVSMGRFVRRKGFHTLIEAVSKIDNGWLWIAGDGEERANLETLVDQVGMRERIRFLGWTDQPMPYMAAGNVFVMPSRHEPLGNVILEAWAQGMPVVSSRAEGPLWMVNDGTDGLLFDIDDADGLTSQLIRLRDDAALSRAIANGGRQTLSTRFSEQAIVDGYLDLISSARHKRS